MTIHYKAAGAGSSQHLKPAPESYLRQFFVALNEYEVGAAFRCDGGLAVCCPSCPSGRLDIAEGLVLCNRCQWSAIGSPQLLAQAVKSGVASNEREKQVVAPEPVAEFSRLECARVTLYRDVKDKVGATVTLSSVIALIKEAEALKKETEAIRETLRTQGKSAYDEAKKRLPAISPSGEFSQRGNAGLKVYSHLLSFDLDKLSDKSLDVQGLKALVGADPHCLLLFISPSNDGLKGCVWADSGPEDHGAAFAALQDYIEDRFKIRPDGACKDLGRLCFLASDPGVIVNEGAQPFDWRSQPKREQESRPIEDADAEDGFPFPLDVLPEAMQQLAASCAEVYQVDAALPAVAALATMAAAFGSAVRCHGAVNGRVTPCNIYPVIGAPSGYGKGVANVVTQPVRDASYALGKEFDLVTKPAIEARLQMAESKKKEILSSLKKSAGANERQGEADLAKQEAVIAENEALRPRPSLFTGSATGPALSMGLKRNDEQWFLYSPEAGDCIRVAAGKHTKDNKGDYDLYLSGYSGESFAESRVSRDSVQLQAPCITLLWLAQPFLLRELWGSEEAQERGFLARTCVMILERDVTPLDDGVYREVSPVILAQWKQLVRSALDLRFSGRKITFQASREAAEAFRDWHNEAVEMRNGEGRESEAQLARCRENAVRLATIIAAAEWLAEGGAGDLPPLTEDHAARGVHLARFFLDQAMRLTSGAVDEKRESRLAQLVAVVTKKGGIVSLRTLLNNHGFAKSEVHSLAARDGSGLRVDKGKMGATGRPGSWLVLISAEGQQ